VLKKKCEMKTHRTFCLGDLHNQYKMLIQCLERSKFDYNNDILISIGDICDGNNYLKECWKELKKIKNFIYIRGNHEALLLESIKTKICQPIHFKQGGEASLKSFDNNIPKEFEDFVKASIPYYIDDKNRLFVHGGIPIDKLDHDVADIGKDELMWDRTLLKRAVDNQRIANKQKNKPKNLTKYSEVWIGHSPTQNYGSDKPIFACNIIATDTDAGWTGRLSLIDVNTKEYFMSDYVKDVYPNYFTYAIKRLEELKRENYIRNINILEKFKNRRII